jgi:hypothetical protein
MRKRFLYRLSVTNFNYFLDHDPLDSSGISDSLTTSRATPSPGSPWECRFCCDEELSELIEWNRYARNYEMFKELLNTKVVMCSRKRYVLVTVCSLFLNLNLNHMLD